MEKAHLGTVHISFLVHDASGLVTFGYYLTAPLLLDVATSDNLATSRRSRALD